MQDIDSLRINFSEDQLLLLNICLAFIMFGISLDLTPSDFKRIFKYPKSVITGLTSQLVLMPVLTMFLIWILPVQGSIALGMILAASCPGGNISNFATKLSKGNTALSITLTSFVTVFAIFTTPINFSIWANVFDSTRGLLHSIEMNPWTMVKSVGMLILVPLLIGMFIGDRFPKFRDKINRPIRIMSLFIFIGFIVAALFGNLSHLYAYLKIVFFIVLVHNGLALLMGYSFASLLRLPETDRRAISLETGVQNTGLGLILVFNFFSELGGMILIVAWWGVWDLVSTLFISLYWSKRSPKS